MNIKFASLSLLITAAAGLGFVQSANANDEDGQPDQRGRGRFNYGLNVFKMDPDTGGGRRVKFHPYGPATAAPSGPVGSVTSGSVPKMALDPTFLAPPKPVAVVPTIAPAVKATIVPVALKPQTFTSIPKNSPLQSIFGNPQPLVATNAPPISPMKQPQQIAQSPAATQHGNRTNTGVRGVLNNHRPIGHSGPAIGGLPVAQIASYGDKGYSVGSYMPSAGGNGNSVDTSVHGVIKHR
jgi:hypothetical protein